MSLKRWLILLTVVVLVSAGLFFMLRNRILGSYIDNLKQKIEQHAGLQLETGDFGFEGITGIRISGIRIFSNKYDTLVSLEDVHFEVSLRRYFKGQPPADRIVMRNLLVNLDAWPQAAKDSSETIGSAAVDTIPEIQQLEFDKLARRNWNRFLDLADFNFRIDHLTVRWRDSVSSEQMTSNLVLLDQSRFTVDITDTRNGINNSWWIDGIVDHKSGMVALSGSADQQNAAQIPFVERLTGFSCAMKSFKVACVGTDEQDSGFRLNISGTASSPSLQHWRIGEQPVSLDSIALGMNLLLNDKEVQTDTSSGIIINRLPLYVQLKYKKEDETHLNLNMHIPQSDAQEFFNSLPEGLFTSLKGIKAKGRFTYRLGFEVNLDDPDSLQFSSEVKATGFGIQAYGTERFSRINESFEYSSIENERVVRTFIVGPENPYYTPFANIPTILVGAVLIAEDGTYWFHRGFNEDSFRQSIATNIREKRFARGGSTITMQLVKNVFLSRDKTISRKLEEAIIVWLIENTGMVSKERMLEVYLNIIEWGPGIYGIGEAAEYYFNKRPGDLTLNECIYLSAIIPRPKSFRYTFDAQGLLRPYLKNYFHLVAGRMVRKEIIPPTDTVNMTYQVELTGRARELVIPVDTIPADTLQPEVPELLFEN